MMKSNALKDWFHRSTTSHSWDRVIRRGGKDVGATFEISLSGPEQLQMKLRKHNTINPAKEFHHYYPEDIEHEFELKHGKAVTNLMFHADLMSLIDFDEFDKIERSDDYRGGGVDILRVLKKSNPAFVMGAVYGPRKEEQTVFGLDAVHGIENPFARIMNLTGREVKLDHTYYGGCHLDVAGRQFLFIMYKVPDTNEVVVEFQCMYMFNTVSGLEMRLGDNQMGEPGHSFSNVMDTGIKFLECHYDGQTPMRHKLIVGMNQAWDHAVLAIATAGIGGDPNTEIERKWFADLSVADIKQNATKVMLIEQFYTEDDVRYRRSYDGEHFDFFKNMKFGEGLSRKEYEIGISHGEYYEARKCLSVYDTDPSINKTRYIVPHGKYTLEVDFFTRSCLPVVEIEFKSEEEALAFNELPDWFGEEITGVKHWNNFAIFNRNKIGQRLPVVGKIEVANLQDALRMPKE